MSKDNTLYSAGYTGTRLCRRGGSVFARIDFDPSDVLFFASGWKFNLFYTRQKKWYGCGDNECDQIGSSESELSEITYVPELQITPQWVACGDKMTAVVSTDGQLFVVGASYGNFKQAVPIDRPIRFVACGTELVVAIPQGPGIFYSHGGNTHFKHMADDINFIDCAAGQYHFLAIGDTGVAYSWGRRKASGQGRKFINYSKPIPIKVDEDVKFKRCFAYNISSFLIDENDDIWSCGANNYGQIGLDRLNKTNTFKKLKRFWQSPIVHIACGDSMAYFLSDDGKLYSCGESDNSRLLMNANDFYRTPTLCDRTANLNVVYMAAGCSHVIVMTGEKPIDFISHPIMTMFNRSSYCHVPIIVSLTSNTIKKPINMDISPSALASHGFQINDIIQTRAITNKNTNANSSTNTNNNTATNPNTTTTNNNNNVNSSGAASEKIDENNINNNNNSVVKSEADTNNKDENEVSKVLGLISDGSLVVESDGLLKLIKEDTINLHKHFYVKERKGAIMSIHEGRSTLNYSIDSSDSTCLLFGFKAGEKVKHEDFGEGQIIGMFGSKLFFKWANDEGKATTGCDCSPFNLHSLISITEPIGRSIKRISLPMENHANIETSPCDLLLTYGIQPNDLVKAGDIFGKVIGQFTCKCVIEDLISREIHFCQLNNIQLIRSYSKEPKFVNYKSFNGEIVSVLVNCSKDEKLLPFDRVLTKKGFATILGKSQDMKSYWILTDNALKLNVGCVLVNDISTFQIVRRIDAPSSDPQIDNSLLSFRESKFLPGDIVLFKNNNYVIIGKTNAQNIPNNSADNHRKDNENWEYVLQNKKDGKIFVRDGFEVIFRPDLPFQRSFQSRQNFRLLFDIDSSKFKGLRVLPGDKVRTKNGVATVIGFKANDIWIKYDDENGAGTIPQQMIFDPNLFKVIHSVGDDL